MDNLSRVVARPACWIRTQPERATARITLTDEATSVPRTTVSDEKGEYDFVALTPATYTITVEALNATNTPLFGNPGTTVTSPSTFGVITSQINYPRLVQLGLRFTF